MNNLTEKQQQALQYLEQYDWPVIPVRQEKKALVKWKQYQTQKQTREEAIELFEKFPKANIAIITGKLSNLTVVDIDPAHGGTNEMFKDLQTPTVQTGSGGWHYYFQYEEGAINRAKLQKGIDIRTEGGYIVTPPSIHESGKKYEWLIPPDAPLLPLPKFVKKWITEFEQKKGKGGTKTSNFDPELLNGVEEGKRAVSAASVAGKFLRELPEEQWETVAWPLMQMWNEKNENYPEKDLRDRFDSIMGKERIRREKEEKQAPIAQELVQGILQSGCKLFHNQHKIPYISLTQDGRKVHQLKSEEIRMWIGKYAWDHHKKSANGETLTSVLNTLSSMALFDNEMINLSVRIVRTKDNCVWYDIGNGAAVRIDGAGWEIVETPPILFTRYNHQRVQVLPIEGGNINDFLQFVNVQKEEERLLLLVYLISCFIPGFPHPLLVLHGSKGAAKTTTLRLIKSLVDPSSMQTLTAPNIVDEFVRLASHHYFFFFDNLSGLPGWMSDALAKACTGDGFAKRELYTNDNDVIYTFQRAIGLNGIPLVVQKPDLLDRSILLGLERIPEEKRLREEEATMLFEQQKPHILGAIFTLVSKALQYYPTIQLSRYPRMADFAAWGCAIAQAMDISQEIFLKSYYANIATQNEAAIEANAVALAVQALMEEQAEWQGGSTALLEAVQKKAEELKIDIKDKGWPKSPSALSRRIPEIQSNLAEVGITIEKVETTRPKIIFIQKTQQNADNVVTPTETIQNEATDTMTALEIQEENVDTNADKEKQPRNDGMSGLSTFPGTNEQEENMTNLLTNSNPWDQYIPKVPVTSYTDDQVVDTLQFLNDYLPDIIKSTDNEQKYQSILLSMQEEARKRTLVIEY